MPDECLDLLELLRMYHTYLRVLSIEQLPRLTDKLVGSLGFGPLARLYAETTRYYIEKVLQVPPAQRTPQNLLKMLKDVMDKALKYLNEPLFDFTYDIKENEIIIRIPIKAAGRLEKLRAAPILGILAGIYEACGYNTIIVVKAKAHHYQQSISEKQRIVIYLEDCSDSVCIVAKRI